jgi:hypothetical protein
VPYKKRYYSLIDNNAAEFFWLVEAELSLVVIQGSSQQIMLM